MEGGSIGEIVTTLDGRLEKADGGDGLSPLSSRDSSCGESDFDRYCSANSVMGTPSVCSSMGMGVFHDSLESDFGSMKSLDGFSLGGGSGPTRFQESSRVAMLDRDCVFHEVDAERGKLSSVGTLEKNLGGFDEGSSSLVQAVMPMVGSKDDLKGVKVCNTTELGKNEDLAMLFKNVENVLLQGVVAARSAAGTLLECNHADEMEDDRCQEYDEDDDDETSSRFEHSDGEDSMFNYGLDGGSQSYPYYMKNVDKDCNEDAGSQTLVLMDSTVAFGCKDWEDFELDGTETNNGMQLPVDFWERQRPVNESVSEVSNPVKSTCKENIQQQELKIQEKVAVGINDFHGVDKSVKHQIGSTINLHPENLRKATAMEVSSGTAGTSSQIFYEDGSHEYLENCSMHNIFEEQCSAIGVPVDVGALPCEKVSENLDIPSDMSSGLTDCPVLQQDTKLPPELKLAEASLPPDDYRDLSSDYRTDTPVGNVSNSVSLWLKNDNVRNHDDFNLSEDKFTTIKAKDFEMSVYYDDFVHDMEEILLDSCDSVAMRLKQICSLTNSEQSSSLRDDGSTASTSGWEEGNSLVQNPLKFDGIEVVGAKQRKGDVSLSERLVGVKEYTVYTIRVWSGKRQWEVERRYRDFDTLYRKLKTYFTAQEWALPSPWSFVEKESRKIFANSSPHVVAERSTLIQECLSSVLHLRYISSPPSALVWFLSPPAALVSSSQSNVMVHQSNVGENTKNVSTLGKTISLIVDIQSQKSVKELLDKQHYTCAGCHGHFDNGKTRALEIAQSFGWGKPRLCEYTGQLFCSSCHKNETVVLPARVLHHWDFIPYLVSQLAKSYLDSIIDKPMLCVSAANPLLFSKVPSLLHIVSVRRRIGAMLPFIRCAFRQSVYRRLGYRKYLLETNAFFALRDLIDLSKGAFAALPAILEAVLKKIQEHITELCLECCDNGVPCGARQACNNPSSLIFPFQEDEEIRKCKSCNSAFHKHCFSELVDCPCGVVFKDVNTHQSVLGNALVRSSYSSSSSVPKISEGRSPIKFISSLFSSSGSDKIKGDNVILMGSLPSTAL